MTEESLQKLFADVKNAPAETNVAEVSKWIDNAATITNSKSIIQKLIQKKFFFMSSIFSTALIISVILFSGNDNNERPKINKDSRPQEVEVKTTDRAISNLVKRKEKETQLTKSVSNFMDTISNHLNNPIKVVEDFEIQPESIKVAELTPIEMTYIDNHYNASGSWKTINDSLHVDTLFNGVETLIFKGKTIGDISIYGSDRKDVEMNASLAIKKKTTFKNKNKNKNTNDCQLSYELDGKILNITLEVLSKKSIVENKNYKQNNKIEFKVPENIAVKVNNGFGDIDVKGINNNIDIKTSFGDIKAAVIVGENKLHSDFGDITVEELNGKIDINTGYGDINAKKIIIKEMMELKSGFGDIDLQITNPVSDCKMDLKTGFGKIKIKNKDLQLESKSKLTFGNGDIKISGKTGFGDVIIR